ncbi:MAG: DNA methyltransferase [Ignavibacteria bacterium RBG_16_35_7]|nr:MAG: DNA methyltransferase [Ignavibacteria bacterium RBG_16_35_7]
MSLQLINQYYTKREKLIQFGGSKNELSIRDAFKDLLNHYAEKKNLMLVPEIAVQGTKGAKVKPDGTLKNALRLDYGYWESKDEKDTIDDEIDTKLKKGYPQTNILFEDGSTIVLIQHGEVVQRVDMLDREKLDKILNQFISYEHPQVKEFIEALEKFKEDLPDILEALRELMVKQAKENKIYAEARDGFLEHCRQEINPDFTPDDVREMIIQHILTEEIFNAVFDETHFHRENNIARELEKVIETFFTGETRRNTLDHIKHYYSVISNAARNIPDHHEKQKFLKVIYENFYKTYNPKAADRLGVVYTPNEIVNFMIESTDYLLQRHFGRTLADKNVEILDPATGTGTFICDIIDYIPKQYLPYKYKNEIHANEVAILPYYVANLNIEYTYKQKMGYYEEFPNLCFVDTLDNTSSLHYLGQQDLHFALSHENAERIKRQNEKKISVIIGNPPYNANQLNENENNKNREYPSIDTRIKDTYIRESTAQKTKLYDMYTRFLRWASDRVDKNGIVAFVSNNSFIDSRTYDGFRKVVGKEFNEIWMIDLKGNARTSGERRRKEAGNVFDDQIRVGVAVYFLVKKEGNEGCNIYYNTIADYKNSKEKKGYLVSSRLTSISFEKIKPLNNNWINLADSDFDLLIPIANKQTKLAMKKDDEKALFKLFSLGVVSNRDEWVYDFNENFLFDKINYFYKIYEKTRKKLGGKDFNEKDLDNSIKWTRDLKKDLKHNKELKINEIDYTKSSFRPFVKEYYYFNRDINEMLYKIPEIYPNNICICVKGEGMAHPFHVIATKYIPHLQFTPNGRCFPLQRFDDNKNKINNITDWGLGQFQIHYKDKKIKREDIFHYVYGVLHNPTYRKKYELNLKREFPRIPFYKDFWKWAKWGKELMELHINYEEAKPYSLKRINEKPKEKKVKQKEFFPKVKEPEVMFGIQPKVKAKLKADKQTGTIEIDEITKLKGIPKEAWEYKLGNRSAIEWILDQYKEKKPKDKTIAEKFNTYRFADYREHVIELLQKVTTVSVETMKIIKEMEKD